MTMFFSPSVTHSQSWSFSFVGFCSYKNKTDSNFRKSGPGPNSKALDFLSNHFTLKKVSFMLKCTDILKLYIVFIFLLILFLSFKQSLPCNLDLETMG